MWKHFVYSEEHILLHDDKLSQQVRPIIRRSPLIDGQREESGDEEFSDFLSDPGVPGPIFVSGCPSVTETAFVDLTDVTLADEDTNSILTDNANRAMQQYN